MGCSPTHCRYLSEASDVLLEVAADGRIEKVNRLKAGALGYRAGELEGRSLAELVAEDQRSAVERLLGVARSGQAVWTDVTLTGADGRPVPLACCFQRMPGHASGERVLVTGLRHEGLGAAARADAAARLGYVAFECHQPAHRLLRGFEMLGDESPPCEGAERCRGDLEHLLDVLVRTATWSPDEGDGHGPPVVDVVGILEAVLRLLDTDPAFAGLELRLAPEQSVLWGHAHPVGLACVAMHLLANARDALDGAAEARVILGAYARGGKVHVEVADNGPGLDAEDLACAFSPCFSRSRKADAPPEHMGLGLTTCHELARAMGGSIRLHSKPDQGTTVTVTLRAAAQPPA